jgi:hypothetical protein
VIPRDILPDADAKNSTAMNEVVEEFDVLLRSSHDEIQRLEKELKKVYDLNFCKVRGDVPSPREYLIYSPSPVFIRFATIIKLK